MYSLSLSSLLTLIVWSLFYLFCGFFYVFIDVLFIYLFLLVITSECLLKNFGTPIPTNLVKDPANGKLRHHYVITPPLIPFFAFVCFVGFTHTPHTPLSLRHHASYHAHPLIGYFITLADHAVTEEL